MSIAESITTAEQLMELSGQHSRVELVQGELIVMTPAGGEHGRIAMRLGSRIDQFVETHSLGFCYAAETGFILGRDPDTVRAPDVAFISNERARQLEDDRGYVTVPPELVVEVVSPHDRHADVEAKVFGWLDFGVVVVWVVLPTNRRITVYRSRESICALENDEILEAQDVLPGFSLTVRELFPQS